MPHPCQVTFQDLDGVGHTVRVEEIPYMTPLALAIRALKKGDFIDQPGPASKLEVEVSQGVVRHSLRSARPAAGVYGPLSHGIVLLFRAFRYLIRRGLWVRPGCYVVRFLSDRALPNATAATRTSANEEGSGTAAMS
jgi:hypothetical protein